jgi:hypothetical protein
MGNIDAPIDLENAISFEAYAVNSPISDAPIKHKTIDCHLFSFDQLTDTLEIGCGATAGNTAPTDGATLTYIITK